MILYLCTAQNLTWQPIKYVEPMHRDRIRDGYTAAGYGVMILRFDEARDRGLPLPSEPTKNPVEPGKQ
jgi:hypothetical protein